jgi:hypothetical protein
VAENKMLSIIFELKHRYSYRTGKKFEMRSLRICIIYLIIQGPAEIPDYLATQL